MPRPSQKEEDVQGPTQLSLIAAALITQLSIICIIAIGFLTIRFAEPPAAIYARERPSSEFAWVLLVATIASAAALFFTREFAANWKPVFGNPQFEGLRLTDALTVVFVIDILLVCLAVYRTGGSRQSPFTSIYFILPALAIFLRQAAGQIWFYLGLVIIAFTLNFYWTRHDTSGRLWLASETQSVRTSLNFAYWLVSVFSFVLATAIGFITRPK